MCPGPKGCRLSSRPSDDTVDADGHVVTRATKWREGSLRLRASVVGRDSRPRARRRPPRTTSNSERRGGVRARERAAQAGYIQARGHGSQCDAGCRSRWGCRAAYCRVRRALRALTLASSSSSSPPRPTSPPGGTRARAPLAVSQYPRAISRPELHAALRAASGVHFFLFLSLFLSPSLGARRRDTRAQGAVARALCCGLSTPRARAGITEVRGARRHVVGVVPSPNVVPCQYKYCSVARALEPRLTPLPFFSLTVGSPFFLSLFFSFPSHLPILPSAGFLIVSSSCATPCALDAAPSRAVE